MPALPSREPRRQLFKPTERAGRLGQLAFAHGCGGAGIEIRSRQMRQQGADLVELQAAGSVIAQSLSALTTARCSSCTTAGRRLSWAQLRASRPVKSVLRTFAPFASSA